MKQGRSLTRPCFFPQPCINFDRSPCSVLSLLNLFSYPALCFCPSADKNSNLEVSRAILPKAGFVSHQAMLIHIQKPSKKKAVLVSSLSVWEVPIRPFFISYSQGSIRLQKT